MNTFDAIINEIERIGCKQATDLHVILSRRAVHYLSIRDLAKLNAHGVTTSFDYNVKPDFLFAVIEHV